ncbi:unnamed protein product [Diabrotica balteata]|uniref:Transposase Helix-turn-helix domain-containing protein n=1 Tax=Diabrotica balteata TaxID=107213 RepID=A0A9N9TD66_DIABA|nr:unnamed protein product [Diabrotica balteata]
MCDEDDAIIVCAAFVIITTKKRKSSRKRRFWVRPSLQSRNRYSGSNLMEDLKKDDIDLLNLEYRCNGGFRNFFRMSESEFEYLLQKIGPKICKQNTNCRHAIPTKERLAVTLRFLCSRDSYHSLMYLFKISKQAISQIIPEVCDALIDTLQYYIKMPKTEAEWKAIAEDYYNRYRVVLVF